jgi:hypothetical protein
MAIESGGFKNDETCKAGFDARLYQYCIVKSSQGLVPPVIELCTGSSSGAAAAFGILQNNPNTSHAATVRMLTGGISKLATVAAVTVGNLIACSTGGTGIVATTSTEYVFAKALTASASTSGIIINVMLFPPRPFTIA